MKLKHKARRDNAKKAYLEMRKAKRALGKWSNKREQDGIKKGWIDEDEEDDE